MDFNVRNLFVLDIGGLEVWITETQLTLWVVMAVLIIFAIAVRAKLKNFTDVPSCKLQQFTEVVVEFFDKFVRGAVGDKMMFLGNWFFAVFAVILFSNFSGVIGLRPPTADWSFTFSLAIVSFVLIQAMGIRYKKGAYFKNLLQPVFFFLPVNILGEISRPVSLSFRLFGNVLAGLILLSVVYTLPPIFLRFGLPAVLHIYFDIISGFLQTYIFCVLSLSFIGVSAGVETE